MGEGVRCVSRGHRKRGLKLRGRGTWEKDKLSIMGLLERVGRAVLRVAEHVSKESAGRTYSYSSPCSNSTTTTET